MKVCQHNSNGGGHSGIFPSTKMSALNACTCMSSSLQVNGKDVDCSLDKGASGVDFC